MLEFLVLNFIPWSMKIDESYYMKKIKKEKEQFFFELFNHVSLSFNYDRYFELYEFQVTIVENIIKRQEIIFLKLPKNDSFYNLIFVNDKEVFHYFIVIEYVDRYSIQTVDKNFYHEFQSFDQVTNVINHYLKDGTF